MKKHKKILIAGILLVITLLMIPQTEAQAASSYSNAKMFYETCNSEKHVEYANDGIYFGSKAKSASTKQKRYRTIGWQITLSANGRSISVDVKRGGNYLADIDEQYASDGYCYNLYGINYNTLCTLAAQKDPGAWAQMCTAPGIYIELDAIITWINPNQTTPVSDIYHEYGNGVVEFTDRSKVWYMRNSSERQVALNTFSTKFTGYYGISKYVPNNKLTVYYNAGYTDVTSNKGYYVNNANANVTTRTINRFQSTTLLHPVNDLGLQKTLLCMQTEEVVEK